MASYEQAGIKKCLKCSIETTKSKCPVCGASVKGRGYWSVRFSIKDSDGQHIHKRLRSNAYGENFKTKAEAVKAYNDFMAAYDPRKSTKNAYTMTFNEIYKEYKKYAIHEIKESSYISYTTTADMHVLPYFKNLIVGEISAKQISDWKIQISNLTAKGKPYSSNYKNKIFSCFTHIMAYAQKFYCLKEANATIVGGFKNTDKNKASVHFWTFEEFQQFYQKLPTATVANRSYKMLFLTLYVSGCRKGECSILTWNDVNFKAGTISIDKTFTRKTLTESFAITPPKTANSIRVTDMPSFYMSELNKWYTEVSKEKDFTKSDYIFGGKSITPETSISNNFNRGIQVAGVNKIRIHDLRHSHVSFLLNTYGYDLSMLYVISDRIGDKPEQILKTYGHLFPKHKEKVIAALENSLKSLPKI
ncbi:MAG: tyrosine-type recombinase/integrase [Bacillota bacterium]